MNKKQSSFLSLIKRLKSVSYHSFNLSDSTYTYKYYLVLIRVFHIQNNNFAIDVEKGEILFIEILLKFGKGGNQALESGHVFCHRTCSFFVTVENNTQQFQWSTIMPFSVLNALTQWHMPFYNVLFYFGPGGKLLSSLSCSEDALYEEDTDQESRISSYTRYAFLSAGYYRTS